jgi:hypothetical protein
MGLRGAQHLIQALGNEIYTKIFIETKGGLEGAISSGEVHWELDAEQALGRIAQLLPHFVRSIAIKKLHQVADEIAAEKGTSVTLAILREVAERYTPTRFKAKFSTIFTDMADTDSQTHAGDDPVFTMEWDAPAQEMLELVPAEFRRQAVAGTEAYARERGYDSISGRIVEEYRKELGF